jgi:CBS domain-containing protein
MNVSMCMSRDVRLCAPTDSVMDAARAMMEIDCGFLPVADGDRLIGAITDRDIAVRGVGKGMGPDAVVLDVMTEEVRYCYEDDDLDEAALQMSDLQIRRMPVLNRDKRLVGVISLADIARAEDEGIQIGGAALCGISEPGGQHTQH